MSPQQPLFLPLHKTKCSHYETARLLMLFHKISVIEYRIFQTSSRKSWETVVSGFRKHCKEEWNFPLRISSFFAQWKIWYFKHCGQTYITFKEKYQATYYESVWCCWCGWFDQKRMDPFRVSFIILPIFFLSNLIDRCNKGLSLLVTSWVFNISLSWKTYGKHVGKYSKVDTLLTGF